MDNKKQIFAIKLRLIVLNFLEFAIWGSYLTSLGNYLSRVGLSTEIGWFYTVQGIVSMFMPALIGIVADRFLAAQKTLSLCQLIAGVSMLSAGYYGYMAGDSVDFATLFSLYTISVAFFMPTIGLSNSVAYTVLGKYKLDTVVHFPPIRVFGTIGFICLMLFVNFAGPTGAEFQTSYMQLITSGVLSLVMALYALTIPSCPVVKSGTEKKSLSESLGLNAFSLFKSRKMALFLIFSMFLGVSLQITNGYANPFITCFKDIPQYAGDWGARNANALISLSQMSEALCILLIPFCLKRFGIKGVMLMSMFAWVLRFGLLGAGDPGSGIWMFVLSMIVYGIAFDFFNVSGSLYIDSNAAPSQRSSAQGMFMLMTNGVGATIGTLAAQTIVNANVFSQTTAVAQLDGWRTSWFIFAGYALVVGLLFMVLFPKQNNAATTVPNPGDSDPEGMVMENKSAK